MNKNQKGFSVVEVIIVLVVIALLGVVGVLGWKALTADKKGDDFKSTNSSRVDSSDIGFIWKQTANGWEAQGNAPVCPAQPMLRAPADLSKVTSMLYPGQTRGGDYKPHGGLRFDSTTDNMITVTAPFDGYITKATRNFAQGTTEVQYGFDIWNNCGVMTRFGHLRELPVNLQKIADTLPEPTSDSRSENLSQPVFVKQGDVLATKVGLISEKNTFFDWGVYDYRRENEASKSAAYRSIHPQGEQAWHGVCWLKDGWLANNDEALLASLPAGDSVSGKNSDYCK